MPPPTPPRPYAMCSEEECRERQRCMEVSEWEATAATFDKSPKNRIMDPRLAVSKYRRSAAGTKQRNPRKLTQLMESWRYLCTLIVSQRGFHQQQRQKSFAATVSFVDDRVRAIQVDLVVSQQSCKVLQLQLVRYQLVALYILSNVLSPKNSPVFEPKFARQAFMTALVAYWNDDDDGSMDVATNNDEILCYTTLCHVAATIVETGSWVDRDEILAAYRQRASKKQQFHPKFAIALRIAAAVHLEHYATALKLLHEMETSPFGQLCRICMAPALNRLRWQSLSHFNKAFMKREKLEPTEVARLLCLPNADVAIQFCTAAGMVYEEGRILFKAAPMRELNSYAIDRKVDDWFCFGEAIKGRVDENNVTIPSLGMLEQLILQQDE